VLQFIKNLITLKKLFFSVEKESQWTNVDDYHPVWMIIVQYGWLISSGTKNWELYDIFQKFICHKAYDISSLSADHLPQWLINVPSG
jgi:hypothetical protein